MIGFEQNVYNISENVQSLSVCVVSTAELGRSVTINITLISGTAESKFSAICNRSSVVYSAHYTCMCAHNMHRVVLTTGGMDYVQQIFQPLIFTAIATTNCVDIQINDDNTVETREAFSIVMDTTEERVTLEPAAAEIFIVDNDCEHHFTPQEVYI